MFNRSQRIENIEALLSLQVLEYLNLVKKVDLRTCLRCYWDNVSRSLEI